MLYKRIISATNLGLTSVLFIGLIILVNASLTGWRIDLTENKLFTLSAGTLNILQSLEEPIRLDFYFSQKALTGYPKLANYGARVRDMLQEYETRADGMVRLNIIDPEVFSEEEDQAVASGMQSVSLNQAGDRAYFGLVGTNSTDDEKTIPFFQANREPALEYDISKLIYNLAYPDKRVIGILSALPVFGDPEADLPKWTIIDTINEFFKVRQLDEDATRFDGIDVLMIIHPKELTDATLFAIDQYALKGGKMMVFIDPMAEADTTKPDPERPMLPDLDSDLEPLTSAWGVTLVEQKIAGDIDSAMHVQARIGNSSQQVIYLPWLKLAKESINQDDFATSLIKVIHMGTAGILEHKEDSDTQFSPLIQTTKKSMQIERDLFYIQRDPRVFLDNFKSDDKRKTIAARLRGVAKTAFPDGFPKDVSEDEDEKEEDNTPGDSTETFVSEGDINVIVVADTDILSDKFWIRKGRFFGLEIPQTIANNGDFVVNALENMSGNNDLSGLRARGEYTRPFERVEHIRREAELEYREREQTLKKTLRETEEKIRALRQEQNTGEETNTVLLTPEQSAEIKKFQALRIDTRKQLRSVQHELKKNIESLDAKLRFFNILFLPLLITIIAITAGVYRTARGNSA